MSGWICLHRKLKAHWIYQESEALKLWITLLMDANHQAKTTMFNGSLITIGRGQMIAGRLSLSGQTGVSERRVRRYLDLFEKEGLIVRQKSNKFSLITITKYAEYQDRVQQESSKRPTTDPATDPATDPHLNNDNNVNNVNKKKRGFSPPSLQEVADYCLERKNSVDPQTFIDFYSSKGWMVGKTKMKDWKASVRTWEKRNDTSRQIGGNARLSKSDQRDEEVRAYLQGQ